MGVHGRDVALNSVGGHCMKTLASYTVVIRSNDNPSSWRCRDRRVAISPDHRAAGHLRRGIPASSLTSVGGDLDLDQLAFLGVAVDVGELDQGYAVRHCAPQQTAEVPERLAA